MKPGFNRLLMIFKEVTALIRVFLQMYNKSLRMNRTIMMMVGQTWLVIQTISSGTLLVELMASNISLKTSVAEGVYDEKVI